MVRNDSLRGVYGAMTILEGSAMISDHISENYANWIGKPVVRPSDFPLMFEAVRNSKRENGGRAITYKLNEHIGMVGYTHGIYFHGSSADALREVLGDDPYGIETMSDQIDMRTMFMNDQPFDNLLDYAFRWGSDQHRTRNLPAFLRNEDVFWKVDGRYHRTDGPASIKVEHDNHHGGTYTILEYYIDGNQMTKEQFVRWYEMTHLEEYKGI